MGSFLRTAGTLALAIGIQVIASGNVVALAASTASNLAATYQMALADKPEIDLKDDGSTYQPPDNGGPDRTQGSGTR